MFKSRKYSKIITAAFFLILSFVLLFNLASAAPDTGIEYAAGTGLDNSQDIRIIIAKIIRVIIGFLGIIAVVLIIYAGWLWMSSEGNEENIDQAKKLLKNAVIGLIIILSAFAIASFILNKLLGGADGDSVNTAGGSGAAGGMSALSSSIISSHYPERNQKDVPRNTKIVITFKEAVDPASVMSGNFLNKENIKIYKTVDGLSGALTSEIAAYKTDDNKTFVFKPTQYLGSPTEKIWYTVALSKNIKRVSGDSAFPGIVGSIAYDWTFEVGTFIDNTPPQIESIIPQPSATEPRNVVIQITFSEAVDPISASGNTNNNFNNLEVTDIDSGSLIPGNFYISNQYRTVEFLTFEDCGINSCGATIYCLPANKNVQTLARAATLAAVGAPAASFPYTGVVDMADNSLDGNADGAAQGPTTQSGLPPFNASRATHAGEGDDYLWVFSTNDTIDTIPPEIDQVTPTVGGSGVDLSAVPQAIFSKLLMSSTLNSSSVILKDDNQYYNYWVTKADNLTDKKTTVEVNHDQFNEGADYAIQLTSGIKDIYQNCYTPCSGLGVNGNPSCCNGSPSDAASCQ